MPASYPTSSKSFSTKATNEVIEASFINDLQDEVTAIETALLTGGVAHNVFPSTAGTRTLGTSALPFGQAFVGGATVTVSTPIVSGTQTWNDAAVTFTGIKANVTDTASAAASLLVDLQVGGTSQFKVSKAGLLTVTGGVAATTGTFSGAVSMTALTATTGAFSSNVTVGGTLGVTTGASTLAALSATTGTFSSTLAVTGAATLSSTLGVTGASTLTGAATLSSTLSVTGAATLNGGAVINGGSGFASGSLTKQATEGLRITGIVGSAYDFELMNNGTSGSTVFRVPTGTTTMNLIGVLIVNGAGNNVLANGGSWQIGGTAARATTAGTNRLDVFNGTAPAGTLADGISLYSTAGELRVMDAAGNATLLSPHDRDTNRWIYDSVDTRTGKTLRIEMELLMRRLDEMFGGGFILEAE